MQARQQLSFTPALPARHATPLIIFDAVAMMIIHSIIAAIFTFYYHYHAVINAARRHDTPRVPCRRHAAAADNRDDAFRHYKNYLFAHAFFTRKARLSDSAKRDYYMRARAAPA